ncbi:MAG TPA: LEPR-XLL domain-containing protein [Tepidisphaeraceae bacterium]|nr:LEPR-XLL domain-containing protein [Tepidisphaeraceae bacterium]
MVDALERRLLLSGTLPGFVQASTDASYTLDNSSGSMLMDLNSGSMVVNADLSTGDGWTNPVVRLHNGAHIYFNAPQTLSDLELHDSSKASVALANASTLGFELPYGNFLQLDALSVDSAATLDLGNNSMILYYAPTQESADKSLIYDGLTRGYAVGTWTGTGINSSAAAADSSHATALGFADNQDLGKTSFDGVTLSDQNQIVVRYTLNGDANLDGVISSGVDGSLFAKGLNGQGSGWDFGDFNYDDSTTNPADLNLFQPNGTSITSPQYAAGLQVQALPFTVHGFAAWSGDVATFYDAAHGGSGDPSDYTATIDWNNGTQPTDAQITQVPATIVCA